MFNFTESVGRFKNYMLEIYTKAWNPHSGSAINIRALHTFYTISDSITSNVRNVVEVEIMTYDSYMQFTE